MRARSSEGLTLIEIVLGITISAVILVMLLSALRLGQRSEEKGEEREEASQRMRILADRLGWLLRGAYPYIVKEGDESTLYFSGTASSVGFVTTSVDPYSDGLEDIAGLKWASIFADDEGLKVRESVYFLEDVIDGEGGNVFVLDPTVKSLEIEYLDPEEEGAEPWVTSWESSEKDYLPAAVRLTLVLIQGEREIEMPPVIAAIRTGTTIGGRKPAEEEAGAP